MRLRQRMPWRKVGHDIYTDDVALELSALPGGIGGVALALRVLLEVRAVLDDAQLVAGQTAPAVGWLLTEAGRAVTPAALARTTGFDLPLVVAALKQLAAHGVAVLSDTGTWGTLGWAGRQEDDSAERKRRQRDRERHGADDAGTDGGHTRDNRRDSHAPGHADVTPQREEGRGKTEEPEGEREQPGAEPLALTPDVPAPKPPRARRPDPSASPDVATVWSEFQRLRVELGLLVKGTVRKEPAADQTRLLAVGLQRAGGAEQLLTVIRRQAESLLRQAEREGVPVPDCGGAEFYDLSTICTAKRIAKMLGQPFLDQRRPATPARASPGRPSRPAPPQNPGSLPPDVPSDFGDYVWKDETT